jgi:hypothetical protein
MFPPILPLHHDGIPQSGLPTLQYVIEKVQESRVLHYSSQLDKTEAGVEGGKGDVDT